MAYRGKFNPTNPNKYKGNSRNIVYRSLWELRMMKWFDTHNSIIEWASEEIVVPYKDPVKGHTRRYFVDFYCKILQQTIQTTQETKEFLVEVKPYSQMQEPKVRKKTRKYAAEIVTYMTNLSKWRAANKFCEKRGWEFLVINEYDIGIKKAPAGYKSNFISQKNNQNEPGRELFG